MRDLSIPLFWKFTFSIITIVVIFGFLNILLLQQEIYKTYKKELEKRGFFIAKSMAERAVNPLVYEDLTSLNTLVNEVKQIDESVAYAFIIRGKSILVAHTFNNYLPEGLFDANKLLEKEKEKSKLIISQNAPDVVIRDFAVPILDGKVGSVRVGIIEKSFFANIKATINKFLVMIVSFLVVGIAGAFVFSYIITSPIKSISAAAENLNLDLLKTTPPGTFQMKTSSPMRTFFFMAKDELDVLVLKFNEMVKRLRKAYAELQSTHSSLLQSEKMASVGTLVAGICHEINNPIAGIKNCMERIYLYPDDQEKREQYLSLMDNATEKIESVVQNLLNFSRKHEFLFEPLNITSLVENVLLLTAYRLESSRISISKNFPTNPPLVSGSPNHLEQVILNLVFNSVDAINERAEKEPGFHGFIKFGLFSQGIYLILEVTDNGISVPENKLNNIFDPFFTTKKEGQGTGLGLSISYNIVKEHNGEIQAERVPEGGMRFRISLPFDSSQFFSL